MTTRSALTPPDMPQEDHMTRMTSRLSALFAALSITIAACAENSPIAPQFTGVQPVAPALGVVTYFNDPSIVDILVSSCDAELPASEQRITPWQHNDMMNSFELEIGCYDIRVLRITPAGLLSKVQRVVINGGDTHSLFAA
jgi:hypothetical protein